MKLKLPLIFFFFFFLFTFQKSLAQYTAPSNALAFGALGQVKTPDASNLKTATITVEAWVKPNNLTDDVPIILKLNSRGEGLSNNEAYSIYLKQGKFVAKASSSTGTAVLATQTQSFVAGKWYHVAAVFNATNLSLYVNGVLQQSTNTGFALSHSTSPLIFGGKEDG